VNAPTWHMVSHIPNTLPPDNALFVNDHEKKGRVYLSVITEDGPYFGKTQGNRCYYGGHTDRSVYYVENFSYICVHPVFVMVCSSGPRDVLSVADKGDIVVSTFDHDSLKQLFYTKSLAKGEEEDAGEEIYCVATGESKVWTVEGDKLVMAKKSDDKADHQNFSQAVTEENVYFYCTNTGHIPIFPEEDTGEDDDLKEDEYPIRMKVLENAGEDKAEFDDDQIVDLTAAVPISNVLAAIPEDEDTDEEGEGEGEELWDSEDTEEGEGGEEGHEGGEGGNDGDEGGNDGDEGGQEEDE